jgi:phenylacetate-CoA ligase
MHQKIVKYLTFPLHEKIIGRKTFSYLRELERLQWASPAQLDELQFEKLKALLTHAGKNIPFYTKRFRESGFDPAKMQSMEDFKPLPFLTKTDIRENLKDMTWISCPGGLHRYNTGGSSGQPLIFYFDRRRQAYDAAARALTHRWWGIDVGDKELYLWGSPLEITNCRMAKQHGYELKNLGIRVVFSTAEVLYEHQKKNISKTFGDVPVAHGYGSREGGFISHECPKGAMHVMDPNVIVEYVRDDRPVGSGLDGEIVVTHLDNWAMPFIRYCTEDVAQFDDKPCMCGRHFSIMKKIQGRTTDFVVTPDGRWQHALSVIYVVRDIPGVAQFKIIQETIRDISVLLKVDTNLFPKDGRDLIVKGFKKRMGKDVNVTIEMVDKIEKDASGKYRYVVSRVAEKYGF